MNPFNADGSFRAIAQGSLRRTAVRGVGLTMASQATGFVVQVASTIILARLLTPKDFGLVSIVTTFSLFLSNVGINAFVEAIVQRPRMDHRLATNLFWINASLGLTLAVGFAFCGSLIATLYGDPLLRVLAVAVSPTILLTSLSGIHQALLKKGMFFGSLSLNSLVSSITSVVLTILLGWAGWGYWALVFGSIAGQLTTSSIAWAQCRWLPGLPHGNAGTKSVVRFAVSTYGHFAANYCTRNLDNVLVGWAFGPQSLGLYKKAYDMCVLPIGQLADPLHDVGVPTLSRLTDDPERYRRYYRRTIAPLALVGMGIGGALTLVGKDLMVLLLGPQWEESGRIFTIFAPAIGARLVYVTYGWIHLSIGRADRLFRWGLIEFSVTAILFLICLPWGPRGIALAWLISSWMLLVPALRFAGSPIGFEMGEVLNVVWKYVAASALAAVVVALIVRPLALSASEGVAALFGRVAGVSMLFGALYVATIVVVHRGFAPFHDAAAIVTEMMPGRFSKPLKALGAFRPANTGVDAQL